LASAHEFALGVQPQRLGVVALQVPGMAQSPQCRVLPQPSSMLPQLSPGTHLTDGTQPARSGMPRSAGGGGLHTPQSSMWPQPSGTMPHQPTKQWVGTQVPPAVADM
jgi:hypothetical protein